jgi:aspartate/methionine/tyrosine aminotransferase
MITNINADNHQGLPETYAQWVRSAIINAKKATTDTYSLFGSSVGEPTALLKELIADGFGDTITSAYQSVFFGGNPVVRATLAQQYGVDEGQVLCTTGATGALSLICRSLLHPGDHVLVETPGFDIFGDLAKQQLCRIDYVERKGPDFQLDLAQVKKSITDRTKMIILSNLHNPSGVALDHDSLDQLAGLAEKNGILVVVDEVYAGYARSDPRFRPAATISANFISLSSLTKSLGLNTLRCGWIVGDDRWLAPLKIEAEKFEFGMSKLSHAVAALVMQNRERFDAYSDDIMAYARPIMSYYHYRWQCKGLITGDLPDYGCITFLRLCFIDDTLHFTNWLASRYGVYVVPGEYFGAPGYVRIGFALEPSVLDKSLSLFEQGITEYLAAHNMKVSQGQ